MGERTLFLLYFIQLTFTESDRFASAGCLSFQPIHSCENGETTLMGPPSSSQTSIPCPVLTPRHRQQRLLWCRRHLNWTRRQWGDVLFTDESKFNVYMADGRQHVWRRRGERFADCCVQQHDRWGDGSVLVWAGVSSATRTQLVILNGPVNAQTYQNQVLNPVVRPFIRQHGGLLQQDNARAHTARAIQQYLQTHNINTIAWHHSPLGPRL